MNWLLLVGSATLEFDELAVSILNNGDITSAKVFLTEILHSCIQNTEICIGELWSTRLTKPAVHFGGKGNLSRFGQALHSRKRLVNPRMVPTKAPNLRCYQELNSIFPIVWVLCWASTNFWKDGYIYIYIEEIFVSPIFAVYPKYWKKRAALDRWA